MRLMSKLNTFLKDQISKCQTIKLLAEFGLAYVRMRDAARLKMINVLPLIVRDYIQRKGASDFFFVQIGANDGVRYDPVRPMIGKGWRGLLVEPHPEIFERLKANYAAHQGFLFECAAISDFDGETTLCCPVGTKNNTAASSTDGNAVAMKLCAGASVNRIKVKAITLPSLFAAHQVKQADMFLVDTEGFDGPILSQLLEKTSLRPPIIQFEHVLMNQIEYGIYCDLLSREGYSLLPVAGDTIAVLA
jgi:FkbM family methyltransferase